MGDLSHRYLGKGSANAGIEFLHLGHVRSHQFSIGKNRAFPSRRQRGLAATITRDRCFTAAVRGCREKVGYRFRTAPDSSERISDHVVGREPPLFLLNSGIGERCGLCQTVPHYLPEARPIIGMGSNILLRCRAGFRPSGNLPIIRQFWIASWIPARLEPL